MARHRSWRLVCLCAVMSASCAFHRNSTAATSTTDTTTPVPATTSTTLPVPSIGWSACGGGLECGSVDVPLDYAHPSVRTITIAVARRPAADPVRRIGSLVINPGGPGDSGIDDLPVELRVLTPALRSRFDVVSFDPRGVGRSAPVHCQGEGKTASPPDGGPLPDPVPQTAAQRQALLAASQAYASACEKYSGDLLPFVGTVDVARDLDRIRVALGDARLTFFGHSYGTLLGATYADLYPDRVRAMVLDGAIDPSLPTEAMSLAQARGFEASLDDFFGWCGGSTSCPWRPSTDQRSSFEAQLNGLRARPLAVGRRTLGPGEFLLGTLSTLYARSFWPSLGRALAAEARGDGGLLLALSDGYQSHGSTNAADANAAITCLDHPVPTDPADYPQLAATAAQRAPVFGPVFAWGALQCATWPVTPTRQPHPIRAPGSPPILVVGTMQDPATPYAWAVSLASSLADGVLVGRRGVDHVAYYYSACVRQIDDAYLVEGRVPPTSTVCSS